MEKVNYNTNPSSIQEVGNGSYLYRWDIKEITVERPLSNSSRTLWECYEITIYNTPTENSITEAVINAIWGGGVEQKLINDYQASQLGILDQSYATPYSTFLEERKDIKQKISEDFAIWKSAT